MIRNIIFDWSGTLVDDLPAVWKATNFALTQAKCAEMTLEKFRAEFCLPFTHFYDRHAPNVPLAQLEGWYHRRFQQIQGSVGGLPHAREFLEFCSTRRLRTFLLSSVHQDHFAAQLAATGFGDYLEKSYVAVRDKREKIHEILKKNRLRAGETLFVGDMQHDIETARHGGIHSCAVLTGYNTLEAIARSPARPGGRASGRTAGDSGTERPGNGRSGGSRHADCHGGRFDFQSREPGFNGAHT